MKVFYFTGTGNSLFAAQKIALAQEKSSLVSILDGDLHAESETVIVTPLYHYSLPPVVVEFINSMQSDNLKFLSLVITAEFPNGNAIKLARELFASRNIELNSAYYIKMPTNYVIASRTQDGTHSGKMLKKAETKLKKISLKIRNHTGKFSRESGLYSLLMKTDESYKRYLDRYDSYDNSFSLSASCIKCGLCEAKCPSGNIKISDKPEWNGTCLSCLRCINICPVKAIEYGDKTHGKKRYINPFISKDLL